MQRDILVIDDDELQRHLLKRQLGKIIDCDVALAECAKSAQAVLEARQNIDVIFCDLNMPKGDGIEFIRHIAEHARHIDLVLISGESQDIVSSVQRMAKMYGFRSVQVIPKPLSLAALSAYFKVEKPTINSTSSRLNVDVSKEALMNALANDEFIAYFQPHVDAQTETICGAEALIRWQHPQHGILSPYYFIDALEQHDLIEHVTDLMIKLSLQECARWHQFNTSLTVAINVSQSDLVQLDFADKVEALTAHYGIEPKFVTLEVTESQLTQNQAYLLHSLSRLRIKRFNVSIDDFGTGHSSLVQLINAPFNQLKIDMSFVKDMFNDIKNHAAVKASISLAKTIGLQTVAEGVECQAQIEELKQLDCDKFQGYFYSKPVSGDEFIEQIKQNIKLQKGCA